ncbi:hypothetical protein MSPP1_001796 [Malassezia sp. CBS 17886]|nr:hypothetical protein MSPP1_001796 [Malassezia sp. CBS 17886]
MAAPWQVPSLFDPKGTMNLEASLPLVSVGFAAGIQLFIFSCRAIAVLAMVPVLIFLMIELAGYAVMLCIGVRTQQRRIVAMVGEMTTPLNRAKSPGSAAAPTPPVTASGVQGAYGLKPRHVVATDADAPARVSR